jgi:hypothetical protein
MSDPTPTPNPNPAPAPAPAPDLKSENEALRKELEALKAKPAPKPDDESLADQARRKREEDDKKIGDSKKMENALRFSLGADTWLQNNQSLLPKSIPGIFEAAKKEVYASESEKVAAIKSGIVTEFFSEQANLDLLTESQKNALDEFRKLTNTVKQERAGQLYDSVFEPTFEMLKKLKKAQQLANGINTPTDAEAKYKDKLMKGSRNHYLGEKNAI